MALVLFKISLNTPGAILQPQPPPCERLVRRGVVVGDELMTCFLKLVLDFASYKGKPIAGMLIRSSRLWLIQKRELACVVDGG